MLIHRAKKESITNIVERFNVPPMEIIPIEETSKEDIVGKKFVERLIQIFNDVKNKTKI